MPSGKTHSKINIFLLPFLLLGGFLVYPDMYVLGVVGIVYLYSTLYFNPDLDIATMNRLFTLKGLLTLPMRILYAPFFRHRGMSHTLLGTLSRLFVMGLFILGVICVVLLVNHFFEYGSVATSDISDIAENSSEQGEDFWVVAIEHKKYLFAALIGVFIADANHIIADKIF
jgi:uncharacterized metal-binding protein